MEDQAEARDIRKRPSPRRERGSGGIFKPKYRDRKTNKMRAARFFWIQYRVNGRAVRENTKSDKISVAKHLLQKRIGEVHSGQWTGPTAQETTVAEIMENLFRDYRINEKQSLKRPGSDGINTLSLFLESCERLK